jgi:hypothetical protein
MCCQTLQPLRTELENESKQVGLALLLDSYEIGVCPFVGPCFWRKLRSGSPRPAATPDGKRIICVTQGPPSTSSIEMEEIGGSTIRGQSVPYWLDILAVSSDEPPKIAFASNLTELRYGAWNRPSSHVIEGMGPIDHSAGWSVDGTRLAFGRNGTIRMLDIRSNRVDAIDSGMDPSWSPDGRWIVYRTMGNHAILFNPRSGEKKRILENRGLAPLPLHWSPDSRYLAYVERRDQITWQLSVFRVQDNAIQMVTPFSPIIGYITDWSWILNYKVFCRECSQH